jgi:hypothetical protein
MSVPEALADKLTIDVQTAAKLLHIGRNQAYAAVERGDIPSLRLNGRILVPVPALLKLLGYSD